MNRPATVDEDAWRPWHPTELARRLNGLSKPWSLVGGWALDLWHGSQTRDHEDLEFTILREDFETFRRALKGMRFHTVASGIIEHLLARKVPPAEISQIWVRGYPAAMLAGRHDDRAEKRRTCGSTSATPPSPGRAPR
ncbi:nucleotidyltransferase domain-containing protein [Mesorhizobium shangrilense]|uniref:nucleotidyltransferase domain-containing protein n=1 Tax=Mesorhizobium shangrilense TaxID=460060 RepID=UPI003F4985C8